MKPSNLHDSIHPMERIAMMCTQGGATTVVYPNKGTHPYEMAGKHFLRSVMDDERVHHEVKYGRTITGEDDLIIAHHFI